MTHAWCELLIIAFQFSCALSAPASSTASTPAAASIQYKSWAPEPDGRGTFSIILSCVTTLLFCASKVLKPNILPSRWRGRCIQLIQILAGMFVPEVVYLNALGQFCDAKGMRDTVNRKAEEIARREKQMQNMHESQWWIKSLWRWLIFEQEPEYIRMVTIASAQSAIDGTDIPL